MPCFRRFPTTTNSVKVLRFFAVVLDAAFLASEASAQARSDIYAGIWNYDLPSASAGANIGKIQRPARSNAGQGFMLIVPQIGNLNLTRKEDGR
jgi:hypothetical protein